MKIQLIEGWETFARWWSTWLVTAGSSIVAFAPELVDIYRNLPFEIQATFPEEWLRYFGLALVALSIPAKLIRQQKLHEKVHGSSDV